MQNRAQPYQSAPQWHEGERREPSMGGQLMSRTTTADPYLIPDIEAFEERVAIHIHQSGIPTDQGKDLAAQTQGFRS